MHKADLFTYLLILVIGVQLGVLITGCKKNVKDGLYLERRLIIENATVEQFCQYPVSITIVSLVRNNKSKMTKQLH